MKRRALALLCAGILAVGMLAGCGGSSDKKDSSAIELYANISGAKYSQ